MPSWIVKFGFIEYKTHKKSGPEGKALIMFLLKKQFPANMSVQADSG